MINNDEYERERENYYRKKIIDFFSKKDDDVFTQKTEILKIAIDYQKGNRSSAMFQLKEKLFFFQKDCSVGMFFESSDIILNMINQIYLDPINKKNDLLLKTKKHIIC